MFLMALPPGDDVPYRPGEKALDGLVTATYEWLTD